MTDKSLYEHIRKLVKQKKDRQIIDVKHENFAEEYCRHQLLKKKQKYKQNKMNSLLKNFKKVQSYINIMDIINNLSINLGTPQSEAANEERPLLPEIIPKNLQLKIKEQIAPILNKRYEEESIKRLQILKSLKADIVSSNSDFLNQNIVFQEIVKALNNNKLTEKLQLIDALRSDIKMKEVYFIQKRFDKELEEINQIPKKIENTQLFHKICSYLHMILQQQHRQKWASKKEKSFKEQKRKNHYRKKIRIPTAIRDYSDTLLKRHSSSQFKTSSKLSLINDQNVRGDLNYYQSQEVSPNKEQSVSDQLECLIEQLSSQDIPPSKENLKTVKSKQQLKENFTFKRRGVKANLMSKINKFVNNINDEQKRNMDVSKKYCKALQSLSEQIKTSYGRFIRQELAQQQDIDEMKKYLDNTLNRNKKDLKKFHHK